MRPPCPMMGKRTVRTMVDAVICHMVPFNIPSGFDDSIDIRLTYHIHGTAAHYHWQISTLVGDIVTMAAIVTREDMAKKITAMIAEGYGGLNMVTPFLYTKPSCFRDKKVD